MSVWGVDSPALYWNEFGIIIVLTTFYAIVSALLYRKIDRRVRVAATLEVA